MITVKTNKEIELMRDAGKITRDVLEHLRINLKAGMTTKELDKLAYDFITKQGATPSFLGYYGYPATTCISIDEQVVHGIPSDDRIIKEGEIVSIDVGAIYKGYHGDAARSFHVGELSPEKAKLVKVTEECFFKAVENLKDGTPLGNIGYYIQQHAESNGFSVVRALVGQVINSSVLSWLATVLSIWLMFEIAINASFCAA